MVEWHMKSRRKTSGGIKRTDRRSTKKLAWKGGTFSETRLAEKEHRVVSNGRGNSAKTQLRYAVNANVTDSLNKTHKIKILNIVQNDANRQYARRNIITKGAVIEVELNGKKHAKVTSRPGQQGIINAVIIKTIELIPKKKKFLKKAVSKTKPKKDSQKTEEKKTETKSNEKPKEEPKKEVIKVEQKKEIKPEAKPVEQKTEPKLIS